MQKQSYLTDLLCRLIETESPTGSEKNIASLIKKEMQSIGFDSVNIDNYSNIVGKLKGNSPGKKILLMSHSDTSPLLPEQMPPKAVMSFEKKYGGKRLKISGPGVIAPKSSIASILEASRQLYMQKNQWKGDLIVAIVTRDLNVNHDGPREISPLISDSDFAIVAEPSNNNIIMATRGVLHIKVKISGISRHWSVPDTQQNVYYIVTNFLERLKKLEIVDDPRFGPTGFNPIDIKFYNSPPRTPEFIEIIIDRRILPNESIDKIIETITCIANKVTAESQVVIIKKMYPFQTKKASVELQWLYGIIKNITRKSPEKINAHFSSNAAYLTNKLNICTLIFGPGDLSDLNKKRHIDLESLVESSEVYEQFVKKFLG